MKTGAFLMTLLILAMGLAMGLAVGACDGVRFCLLETSDGRVECYECLNAKDCRRCAAAGGKVDLLGPGPCKGCMETDMSNCS